MLWKLCFSIFWVLKETLLLEFLNFRSSISWKWGVYRGIFTVPKLICFHWKFKIVSPVSWERWTNFIKFVTSIISKDLEVTEFNLDVSMTLVSKLRRVGSQREGTKMLMVIVLLSYVECIFYLYSGPMLAKKPSYCINFKLILTVSFAIINFEEINVRCYWHFRIPSPTAYVLQFWNKSQIEIKIEFSGPPPPKK